MASDFHYEEALRRLALNDERFVAAVLARYSGAGTRATSELDEGTIDDRTRRLIDLAALITVGSGPAGIDAGVSAALGAGASPQEVVEVLLSIAPAVGAGRVVSAAPHIAVALGYDMDADFEELHPRHRHPG